LIASIGVLVTFPSGETRQLAPGPSSIISQAVIEVFAKRFLEKPAVLWPSESGNNMVDAPVVQLPPSAHERFASWKESPVLDHCAAIATKWRSGRVKRKGRAEDSRRPPFITAPRIALDQRTATVNCAIEIAPAPVPVHLV
jgi:hypothetical protein